MVTDLFTTWGISESCASTGSTCKWLHHLEKITDPLKCRAVAPWSPLSLSLPTPLSVSTSGLYIHHGTPSFQDSLFLLFTCLPDSPSLRSMFSLVSPMPAMTPGVSMPGFSKHLSTQSTDIYWYAFSIKLQKSHLQWDLVTAKWLVHISRSPQWGPTFGLLSLELYLCFSVILLTLPCSVSWLHPYSDRKMETDLILEEDWILPEVSRKLLIGLIWVAYLVSRPGHQQARITPW